MEKILLLYGSTFSVSAGIAVGSLFGAASKICMSTPALLVTSGIAAIGGVTIMSIGICVAGDKKKFVDDEYPIIMALYPTGFMFGFSGSLIVGRLGANLFYNIMPMMLD